VKAIWKFPLQITDRQPVAIPAGSQLLTVQMQGEQPCLWSLVNPDSPRTTIVISIRGTGHPISGDAGKYIATFQTGPLVFHAFDMGSDLGQGKEV
jgi:hypothetical protein